MMVSNGPVAETVGMADYPHLFSPVDLGAVTLRNRIAFASIFSALARGGDVTEELIQFYVNRAAGGAALVVTEPLIALRQSDVFGAQVNVYRRRDVDGITRWAEAVRAHSSLLVAQLQDSGRGDVRPKRKPFSLGPSALPDDLSWTMPHAMTTDEIAGVCEDFTAAAVLLKRAGFGGIEVSGGHGHLHHQFLSPWANRREDEYGGSRENRVRMLAELIAAIRSACGESFVIGVRLPGNDGIPGSIDYGEAAQIADALTAHTPPNYVNFVHGTQASTLYMHVPDMHGPRGTYVDAIADLRSHCNGVPVASTGRILEPGQAETILAEGKADLVMMGRTLLADPGWGRKAAAGRASQIRACVSCNNCWGTLVHNLQSVQCDNNPRVGRRDEVDFWPKPAAQKRRIVVVGGGVAGLETAWVAAARGHAVTVFSAGAEAGGKARLYATLPGCEAASSVYDYQLGALARTDAEIKLGHEATLEDILAVEPDEVVLASGGEMIWPDPLPREWQEWGIIPDLWALIAMLPRIHREAGTAVLYDFDGTDVAYSAAEALAERFDRVVILNPVECLARDEALVKRQSVYRRLLSRGVDILPWSEPSAASDLEQAQIIARNIMGGPDRIIEEVALFAYATPRAPRDKLLAPLRASGVPTHIIGDAFIPRSAMTILREAHDLGDTISARAEQTLEKERAA